MDTALPDGLQAGLSNWLDWSLLAGALGVALPFKPWLTLSHRHLQNPWLTSMLMLPFSWWTQHLLPGGMGLHITGVCLMVLMFGWPLAMWSLPLIALAASLLQPFSWPGLGQSVSHTVWAGVVPGTLALLMGLAVRRWLPKHLFVYILGRGFFVTALAITATACLTGLLGQMPATLSWSDWMLGHWLLGWGEAVSTGMLVSIFVAFKPEWLLTYSDERYLPESGKGS